jgi:hypothetical protein
MPDSITCPDCKNDIPQPAERCPHCGQPGIFWNVLAAAARDERKALIRRYRTAKLMSVLRKAGAQVQAFENALADSKAVIARSESELLRLATSTRQLYATYYQLMEGGSRLPDADEWDVLRQIADTLLFPNYKREMRFAALSLDGVGLANYGSCSIALRESMIAHRTSVFEENSVLFIKGHRIRASKPKVPNGFRATWADRAKLCIAKLAANIDSTTTPVEYSKLLLSHGATSADDKFVEVHIWGPISVLTMERVTVTAPRERHRATIIKAVKSKLAQHGVAIS